MEEYISKEKTIKLIDKMIKSVEPDAFKSGLVIPVLTVAKEIVSELPNEDVSPVVHARWENIYFVPESSAVEATCLNCKKQSRKCREDYYDSYTFDFCPNCGAKMDLK